jgi:hypothetical protein
MRILQLCTYPLEVPRHGGQIRASEMRAVLRSHDHDVRTVAVYAEGTYASAATGRYDIVLSPEATGRVPASPYLSDLETGQRLASEPVAYARLEDIVRKFRPEVVMLEQPYLWPAARRMLRDGRGASFKIVYSSQNIEAKLKEEVLVGCGFATVAEATREVDQLERELAQAAQLCIACTQDDCRQLQQFGASKVLVAENGSLERRPDPGVLKDWKDHLAGVPFALFVGSGHPPNAHGFWEMFAPSLAFLAPDQCVIAVGGVGELLVQHECYLRWEQVNASRLRCTGVLGDAALAALLRLSACVILPITTGGGSNIKTAEALINGNIVIGTSASFRGYSGVAGLSGVNIADQPQDFRRLVSSALAGNLAGSTGRDVSQRQAYTWSATLSGVAAELARL